jgi:hypothetical protein
MSGETRDKQPYMGVLSVNRCSGQANLFDSDVQHHHFIRVSLSHADVTRGQSSNWIHEGNEITEVWMSEIQWAQFVSSFNGGVTPVTLKRIEGKQVTPPLPVPPETFTFQKEMNETARDSLQALRSAVAKLEAALVPKAKTPNKTELGTILSDLQCSLREFTNNIPFVEMQFGEHIKTKMTEAKVEFEGWMNHRLRNLGLEAAALAAVSNEAPKPAFLPEASGTKDANQAELKGK